MTQTFAEVLLLIPSALCAGLLIFVAEVVQPVMEDLDGAAFRHFLTLLYRRATHGVCVVTLSLATFIGMFPYFYIYGFRNRWFTAGLVVFFISGVVGKALNLPIYNRVMAASDTDIALLRSERVKLRRANHIRAWICFVSIVLMAVGFA